MATSGTARQPRLWCGPSSLSRRSSRRPRQTDLARELAALRAEVQQLRADVDALRGVATRGVATPASFEMLQNQVAELAQVKVESDSKLPVKLFGTVHAGVFANSGR